MEVLQDKFKETKVGLVPIDWEVKTMSELGTFFKGKSIPNSEIKESGIPIIRYGDLYVQYKNANTITHYAFFIDEKNVREDKLLKKGDIVLAGTGETQEDIGKAVAFTKDDKVFAGGDIIVFRPNDGVLNSEVLSYSLNTGGVSNLKSRLGQGLSIFHLYSSHIEKLPIPLPPLPEQQKIAEILSTVDEQISATERIIEKSKELKKGLMQKLFSEGIGHSEFNSPEGSIFRKILGHIPSSWEVKELSEIADFKQGVQVNVELQETEPNDENIRFIRIVDYTQDNEDIRYVSNTLSKYAVQAKDIVMVRYGTPGVIGRGIEGVIANNMFKISLDNKILLNDFFDYFFNQNKIQEYLLMGSGSSTMPALNFSYLRKFQIATPTIEEQQKIVDILSEADKKVQKEQQYKSELEQLKKGLMQQLLTGQKRGKV